MLNIKIIFLFAFLFSACPLRNIEPAPDGGLVTECGVCETPTPLCNNATKKCVGCLANGDCMDPANARCDAAEGVCGGCTADSDCSHIAGKGICHMQQCVQCTGVKNQACGDNGSKVCNSRTFECTDIDTRSAAVCKPCVSDLQCIEGQLCVPDVFGDPSKEVETVCLWRQDATGNVPGTPKGSCATNGRPYDRAKPMTSLDGVSTAICALNKATCAARRSFGIANSCTAGVKTEGHAQCGAPDTNDGYCLEFGSGNPQPYRCSYQCTTEANANTTTECPDGSACVDSSLLSENTGLPAFVCSVN